MAGYPICRFIHRFRTDNIFELWYGYSIILETTIKVKLSNIQYEKPLRDVPNIETYIKILITNHSTSRDPVAFQFDPSRDLE